MDTQRVNLGALAVAFLAGLFVLYQPASLLTSLSGLALLALLLALGHDPLRTGMESLAFAMVCGLAALDASSFVVSKTIGSYQALFQQDVIPPAIWLVASGIFWFVDRSRAETSGPQPVRFSVQPPATAVAVPQPAPVSYQSATEQQSYAAAAAPASVPPPPAASTTGSTPAAAQAAPLKGKPVEIYVNMLDQGMKVLRRVHAEHLGRDYYLISDEMPADESWEFVPGQVVRCTKKNLSNGKGLVAYEEAPRT